MMVNSNLVGGIPTPLQNMSSPVGIIIPNIWENKKCSKPPTRSYYTPTIVGDVSSLSSGHLRICCCTSQGNGNSLTFTRDVAGDC